MHKTHFFQKLRAYKTKVKIIQKKTSKNSKVWEEIGIIIKVYNTVEVEIVNYWESWMRRHCTDSMNKNLLKIFICLYIRSKIPPYFTPHLVPFLNTQNIWWSGAWNPYLSFYVTLKRISIQCITSGVWLSLLSYSLILWFSYCPSVSSCFYSNVGHCLLIFVFF